MKQLVKHDPWKIIQTQFTKEDNEIYESLTSIGNGYMGMRGNHEEDYSGETLQGTYFAGVYYPDKTKVGWWKNGYPEYFAKVLNAINFIGLRFTLDGINLDLNTWQVNQYERTLDMKRGLLKRNYGVTGSNGLIFEAQCERFLSLYDRETGVISYRLKVLNGSAKINLSAYLDGNVVNRDANYDEFFWEPCESLVNTENEFGLVCMDTKKTAFRVAVTMKCDVFVDDQKYYPTAALQDDQWAEVNYEMTLEAGQTLSVYKYIGAATNRDYDNIEVAIKAEEALTRGFELGYENMKKAHMDTWAQKWAQNDIVIEGDVAAQQAIRFNICQMNQTYTGEDPRLNIGPKGFTGEKYGGSTYWDTEAYCLYFYLGTAPAHISKNLLIYRYHQLEKAKENAQKLGVKGALYPMVTMNGEECHNEWEITFEEIHRNGAIAYAIYNYVRYTADVQHLLDYGFIVLAEIARYWASRVNYVAHKQSYMILGVTGPNEYENNVNNNWYTNKIAAWTLQYTLEVNDLIKSQNPKRYDALCKELHLENAELDHWLDISNRMYYPEDKALGIFLQQDGYLDKEQILVKDLPSDQLPLNQKWSWDKILRSCFIKQADVLQGLFFFEDEFSKEQLQRNFDFYEPRTVHESSLSPCVHSILAARLGMKDKAYEMYLRTARLDLDNYNNDTSDGLHITSMAGTWMSVVLGFGGLRVQSDRLIINPVLPEAWSSLAFRINFRERIIQVNVNHSGTTCELISGEPLSVMLNAQLVQLS